MISYTYGMISCQKIESFITIRYDFVWFTNKNRMINGFPVGKPLTAALVFRVLCYFSTMCDQIGNVNWNSITRMVTLDLACCWLWKSKSLSTFITFDHLYFCTLGLFKCFLQHYWRRTLSLLYSNWDLVRLRNCSSYTLF